MKRCMHWEGNDKEIVKKGKWRSEHKGKNNNNISGAGYD